MKKKKTEPIQTNKVGLVQSRVTHFELHFYYRLYFHFSIYIIKEVSEGVGRVGE